MSPTSTSSARSMRAPVVEPRLQARRVEVARNQGRRRLRKVLVAVAVAVVVVGAFAVTRSPALDVDQVAVAGATHSGAAAVREASGIALGRPMISLSTDAAVERVEALPWVDHATVQRSWPGTIRIRVVERVPVAIVGTGSDAVIVDADGRALGAADAEDLPAVGGDPVAVGERLDGPNRAVVAVLGGLPPALRAEVASGHATDAGVSLTLTDDVHVRWGDRSQPTAKADALAVLLEQADRSTIDVIDVSVPRAATVTRK